MDFRVQNILNCMNNPPSDDVQVATAINVLNHTIKFINSIFSNKNERNKIMSSLFKAIEFGKPEVIVAAIRCLRKIVHQYMELDMLNDLLPITEAIKSDDVAVVVEIMRFWSEVCAVEIKLANTAGLIEITDTYSPSKAASYSLTKRAKRYKNRITEDVLPFVKHNINGGKVEAGIIALGPDRSILEPVFCEAMPHLLQACRGSVGYDSAMWTNCRACFYIPETVIGQNSLPSLIGPLIKGLNERPIVAAHICRGCLVNIDQPDPCMDQMGQLNINSIREENSFRKVTIQYLFDDCEANMDLCLDRSRGFSGQNIYLCISDLSSLAPEQPVREDDLDFCISTAVTQAEKSYAYSSIPYKIYQKVANNPNLDFEEAIRNLNLSEKGILFIPINSDTVGPGKHWFLVIVNRFSKRLYLMDSFIPQDHDENTYQNIFRNVFRIVKFIDKVDNVPFRMSDWSCNFVTDTVQQPNTYDCGVYTIMNVNAVVTRTQYTNSENWRQKILSYLRTLNPNSLPPMGRRF